MILSTAIDLKQISTLVVETLSSMKVQITSTQRQIDSLVQDEQNLTIKVERKRLELERLEKRLNAMDGVRPPYMDEFDKVEKDLILLYDEFTVKFKHLGYLEHQMDIHEQHDQEHHEETEISFQNLQKKLKEEDALLLRGYNSHDNMLGNFLISLTI